MTTHTIRKTFGLTRRQLSEKYQIPLRTIENWDARKCMPHYVGHLIFSYELVCRKYGIDKVY